MAASEGEPKPAAPAKAGRTRAGHFECQLGIILGAAGLIASRLGQLWVAFDVFAQFTLQFVIVTAAFGIGLLIPRLKLASALAVLLAGLLAIGVWPHLASLAPHVIDTVKPGERELKVASFNVWYDNHDSAAVQAEIERLDADVITLIELEPGKRAMIANLKARYPYQTACFNEDYCNLAILSKFPILDSAPKVGWDGPPLIMAKLGPEGGNLTVMGVHTIRFPHSRAQFRQVQELTRFIATIPGPKLVMGDFNATPFSRVTQTLASGTGMIRLTTLPSWPSRIGLPQVAIDHIFVTPALRPLVDEHIGNPAGSDHYPVAMTLALPLTP